MRYPRVLERTQCRLERILCRPEGAICGSDSSNFLTMGLLSALEDVDRLGTLSDQLRAFSSRLWPIQANRGPSQTMRHTKTGWRRVNPFELSSTIITATSLLTWGEVAIVPEKTSLQLREKRMVMPPLSIPCTHHAFIRYRSLMEPCQRIMQEVFIWYTFAPPGVLYYDIPSKTNIYLYTYIQHISMKYIHTNMT